ncbi:MAG: Ig-like domain-containing protein, partial [Acidobacteria bacterium]|nr:Ig-like domain-containing protein [Acidobacteriota bacterium]
GAAVTFTSVGAQSLAGLLPLGWSPLGSAEIVTAGGDLAAATLSFDIPEVAVAGSGKSLALVRYDADRDEWRVVVPVVNVVSGRAVAPIVASGMYALVYPDAVAAAAIAPGAALSATPDPCATSQCAPITKLSFALDPDVVLPDGTAVATLVVDGDVPFPSGTAVQAWIDEELRLTDGTTLLDPPFAADLILYRSLDGATASALFHLSPSARAAEVILEVGYDHVRVRPYPGRLARGTLIGSEGGRVPSDGAVVVEIPAGASPEPVRASAASLPTDELAALGAITGFRILGGVALELERVDVTASDSDGDGVLDPAAPVVLLAPARITFHADPASVPDGAQIVVAEILGDTPYGRVIRLAARAVDVPFEGDAEIFTTSAIDRSVLPLDGVVREGRYLFLAAETPIAFATGSVRRGATGAYQEGAHVSIGEGTPSVAGSSPERAAIVPLGDLLLESQPPQISSTVPSNGATAVSLTTTVRVQFDRALDPASIGADAIVVSGPAGAVAGTVSADGPSAILWSLPPGSSLAPGAIHTARVSAQIRSSAGAPLGRAHSFSFSTLAVISNAEVRPERISITIPNASGVSTIRGTDGALPSGWQAVAVRRGKDFASDPITISDLIDLHAINNAGSLAAIIPLTPFVNAEGTGFIARQHDTTTFTSKDGIAVTVPAGAFDTPVLVSVETEPKTVLADVPNLDAELQWSGSVELNLDCSVPAPSSAPCVANERLDLEIPIPPNTDPTGRIFLLGLLGNSVRGPRIMIVDTLRIEDGKFTTAPPSPQGASVVTADSELQTPDSRLATAVKTNADVKKTLAGVKKSGTYSAVDVKVPAGSSFGWSLMDVTGGAYDLFSSTFSSLYASSLYLAESRGRVAIPVLTGTPFKITGYDPATGFQAFEQVYDPIPLADPGAVYAIESPLANLQGPYPVFGTPFRIETLDVDLQDVDFTSVRNFTVHLQGGNIKVADAANALPADVSITLLNPSNGALDSDRSNGLQVPGKLGDRIIILVHETNV